MPGDLDPRVDGGLNAGARELGDHRLQVSVQAVGTIELRYDVAAGERLRHASDWTAPVRQTSPGSSPRTLTERSMTRPPVYSAWLELPLRNPGNTRGARKCAKGLETHDGRGRLATRPGQFDRLDPRHYVIPPSIVGAWHVARYGRGHRSLMLEGRE